MNGQTAGDPCRVAIRSGGIKEMKVWIDRKVCLGDETCVTICPEIFELRGKRAVTKTRTIPEELEDACLDAAESCPGEAILVTE